MWEPRDKQEAIEALLNSHLITFDDAQRLAESSEADVMAEYRRLSETVDPEVIKELNTVRESGKVNMLDVAGVTRVAEKLGLKKAAAYGNRIKHYSRNHRASAWVATLNQLGAYVKEQRNGTR